MDAQAINAFPALSLSRPQDRLAAASPAQRLKEPAAAESAACREMDRKDLLAEIKKKIKAGYYSSRDVVEDLSDTFAKAFNQI